MTSIPVNPLTPIVTKTEFLLTISIQYRYNINKISDENKEKYQFGDN